MVLDRAGDEDDPLAQQPRINVEAALAPVRLLDDDGDEAGNDVLMIHGKCGSLRCVAPYIGRIAPRFKPGNATMRKGGRHDGRPPSPVRRFLARPPYIFTLARA